MIQTGKWLLQGGHTATSTDLELWMGIRCNFDGYTNSIYSVTVSAVDFKGLHPYYSEPCAANMVVAYSSGSGQHIVRG